MGDGLGEIAFDYTEDSIVRSRMILQIRHFLEKTFRSMESSDSYTFEGGISNFTSAIGDNLGDRILTSSTVIEVKQNNDIYEIKYLNDDTTNIVKAKTVVFATPAPITSRIGNDVFDKRQHELLTEFKYGTYVTVALFSDEPLFNEGFDLAFKSGGLVSDLYDSTWVDRNIDENFPEDIFVNSAYIAPRSMNDDIVKATDEEIMEWVYSDLEIVYPDIRETVTGHDIHRFTYAYPVMYVGIWDVIDELNDSLDEGAFLAGDYLEYPTFDAASETGKEAAEEVIEYLNKMEELN